jgi:acetyl-CoA carboxylase biotin carboxyl carrier protein
MAEIAGKQRGSRGAAASRSGGTPSKDRPENRNGTGQNMTDLDFLRGLIEAVDQSGIDTLEINRAGTRIRIAKTPSGPASVTAYPGYAPQPAGNQGPAAAPAAPSAPPSTGALAAPAAAEPAVAAAPAPSNLVDVKSPMVGTFYRGPAPDAPPYVEPGTQVSKGQTLCILEAMKLMNELECEVDGIVREILVEDADPVEFGQVLYRIEPTGSR